MLRDDCWWQFMQATAGNTVLLTWQFHSNCTGKKVAKIRKLRKTEFLYGQATSPGYIIQKENTSSDTCVQMFIVALIRRAKRYNPSGIERMAEESVVYLHSGTWDMLQSESLPDVHVNS